MTDRTRIYWAGWTNGIAALMGRDFGWLGFFLFITISAAFYFWPSRAGR